MVKIALIFGCNYAGTKSELGGCINDANHIEEHLSSKGYMCHKYVDSNFDVDRRPTRNTIINTLRSTVQTLESGDVLFISYSGHGSWIPDRDGDEEDGRDECLCPCDYSTAGMITDDELRNILSLAPRDSKIFVLFDCCHSGTALDLKYNYIFAAGKKYSNETAMEETRAEVWLLSGCTDASTSADITYGGVRGGALTISFLECVDKSKTFCDLAMKVRNFISSHNLSRQIPQLSSGSSPHDEELYI